MELLDWIRYLSVAVACASAAMPWLIVLALPKRSKVRTWFAALAIPLSVALAINGIRFVERTMPPSVLN